MKDITYSWKSSGMRLVICLLGGLLLSCDSDPKPTIIEGTLWWDDGTPANHIYLIASSQKSNGGLFGGAPLVGDIDEQHTGNDNQFYLELEAMEDIKNCRLSFRYDNPNDTSFLIDASSIICGEYNCDDFIAGKHYNWEIILPQN